MFALRDRKIGNIDNRESMQAGMHMPMRKLSLIEQVIEQDFKPMFSSKSTACPTSPPFISNTKKKGVHFWTPLGYNLGVI